MSFAGIPFQCTPPDLKDFAEFNPDEPREDPSPSRPRKHVTSACKQCKHGKVKCDGNRPCVRCLSRDIACSYRSEEDGRSRVPLKRKIESLERENGVLHELMNQIRGGDDLEVMQVLSLIRNNASLHEVHNSLLRMRDTAELTCQQHNPVIEHWHNTTNTALLQNNHPHPQLPAMQSSVAPKPASRVLSVSRLIDNPIHQVSAARWTTVTQDDQLVSHLISLWVTWAHVVPDGIVLEPFLRDLKRGDTDSQFCSPFLVSCVLAAACPYSDYDEAKTTRGTASKLMVSFVGEAKERLAQCQSAPSITNVQGLGILYIATSQIGRDRDGYHYAIQAVTLGEELTRARKGILETARTNEAKSELAFVLDTTCWGVFCATTASMSAWMRPQLIMRPKMRYPTAESTGTNFHETKWWPYPHDGVTQSTNMGEVLEQYSILGIITAELTDELYGNRDDTNEMLKREALEDIEARLIFWHARLPESMKQALPESPAVITMLMWYHGIVLKLRRERSPRHSLGARQPNYEDDDDDETRWNELVLKNNLDVVRSALDIVGLCQLYQTRWGYNRLHCFMVQPCYNALYVLIARNSQRRYDNEITEILTSMRAMSRRFPFAFSLLHMTHIDLQQRGIDIPSSAEKLFEEFEQLDTTFWMEKGSHNSVYPSPQLAVGPYVGEDDSETRPYPTTMNEFLRTFDSLRIP